MIDLTTVVGVTAALLTTISNLPQLIKCWQTGEAGDLSMAMFSILAGGVAMWIVYGYMRSDVVLMAANTVSLALLSGILYFKLRSKK